MSLLLFVAVGNPSLERDDNHFAHITGHAELVSASHKLRSHTRGMPTCIGMTLLANTGHPELVSASHKLRSHTCGVQICMGMTQVFIAVGFSRRMLSKYMSSAKNLPAVHFK